MNPIYRILSDGDEEFLLNRIKVASSSKNEMVSSEWRKYLEVKSMQDISVERLENLANPTSGLTYGFYGRTTDDCLPLSYELYQGESIYQKIIQIPEPDAGNPPKKFALGSQNVSGNFLRQAYFAFKLLANIKKEPDVIVEIGGGYGLLSYIWKVLFPKSKVVIVDIPESILLQYHFLKQALPDIRIGHLLNAQDAQSDLGKGVGIEEADITLVECNAINCLDIKPTVVLALASFQEMTVDVVDSYVQWVEKSIGDGGYFFVYSCHGLDPLGYQSPADVNLDEKWKVVSCEQSTLVANNYHHLQLIYQRTQSTDCLVPEKRRMILNDYYHSLTERDHSKMKEYQSLLFSEQVK